MAHKPHYLFRFTEIIKRYGKLVGIPYLTSRLILQIIGYLSSFLLPNPNYPSNFFERGWNFTPYKFLDIWIRWDAGWYKSIVTQGYSNNPDILNTQSNIAFFPMYPLLIRISSFFAIDFSTHNTLYAIFALLISNLFFLFGLIFICKICDEIEISSSIKETIIWFIVLYPYGFFFSAAYSESIFLFFLSFSFFYSIKEKWVIATIAGMLLTLTRPLGVLIVGPLVLTFIIKNHYRIKIIDLALFALIPLTLLLFFSFSYLVTGDFLGPLHVQSAWGKEFQMPWNTLFSPNMWIPTINIIDIFFTFLSMILLIYYFIIKLPNSEWAIFIFVLVSLPLLTGTVNSSGRYTIIAFPMYISLGNLVSKKDELRIPVYVFFSMIQALLFAGWTQGYFVG